MQTDLFCEVVTRSCNQCKKHYLGEPGFCPQCESDRDVYARGRKKGDKRSFIPYEELFKEWQARKNECASLRKAAQTAQDDRNERERLESEKRWLLLALNNTIYDKNLLHAVVFAQRDLEDVTKERDRLKSSNEDLLKRVIQLTKENQELMFRAFRANMRESVIHLSPSSSIPSDIIKRLRMLCHPDRHGNSEMSTKVMQWLNTL
jgi:hypothetical protein